MYTQCPDCETAFRVTAEVLKQAAGQVRCGGCGNPFNALMYLSEQMPEQQPVADTGHEQPPELMADATADSDAPPTTISAEQSAALLKTLDELAGSDIRIEDTGIEWRVLNEGETLENGIEDVAEAGSDTDVNARSNGLSTESEALPQREADATSVDELRFDDNTPLPEDFDLADKAVYPLPTYRDAEAVAADAVPDPDPEEPQPDIALSDPDEWTDLLGELDDTANDADDTAIEAVIDTDAEIESMPLQTTAHSVADNDDAPLDVDTQFALQAEAMGIDLSGMHAIESGDESKPEPQSYADSEPESELDSELESELQLALESTGTSSQLDLLDADQQPDVEYDSIEAELAALEEADLAASVADNIASSDQASYTPGLADDAQSVADVFDDESIGDALIEIDPDDAAAAPSELEVAPPSEEENTQNRLIDLELMALAQQDEDGIASTIVAPSQDSSGPAASNAFDDDAAAESGVGFETIIMEGEFVRTALENESLANESQKAAESQQATADIVSRLNASEEAPDDTEGRTRYGMIGAVVVLALLLLVQALHQSRQALATRPAFNNAMAPVYRAIGQPLQPEWNLAGWRIEASKGDIYTIAAVDGEDDPAVTGAAAEQLTITSIIGNNSANALPYPLIWVSLTDRFEETIGSRIMEPAEYLANGLDPRKRVQPGNSFNAVMLVESPSADVYSFKLYVCYRLSTGQLRCAVDDFK